MNAQIFAVGIFRKDIIPYLQYDAEHYGNTRDGVLIAENVFFIESGTTASCELAACFDIDPWDFNQHALDPWRADLGRLSGLFDDHTVAVFIGLRDAGFRFFFLPNG